MFLLAYVVCEQAWFCHSVLIKQATGQYSVLRSLHTMLYMYYGNRTQSTISTLTSVTEKLST